jgi:hypothetical protein
MPILAGFALALGLFALYVATRPAAFRITRSLVVGAPAAAIFPLINDFREWVKWSPWEKLDPNMKKTYDGAESGVGASYHWVGDKSGEGKMTLTESVPDRRVVIDLRFIKPFPANNNTVFTLEPEGEGTRVTWTMDGQNSFIAKAFNVVMNMDKLVGKDFESGLAAMATAATAAR